MGMISASVFDESRILNTAFNEAKPFRYVAIDNFFTTLSCEKLLNDFPGFEARYALNEMGNVGAKAVRMDVRDISECYRELDKQIQTSEFLTLISQITGIPDLLYDGEYVGGGTHENRQGQGLDAHIDFNYHPTTGWHRRLNLIVYLNPVWEETWGGCLALLSNPWDLENNETTKILPMFNRAVIFETNEVSWHGFDVISLPSEHQNLSRRSFAIYLYTKERPSEERAASHATVYVPSGLPADLEKGEVITQGRLADLRQRFQRMKSQLRFLYDREKHFSAQITSVENALNEARTMLSAGLQGYARQEFVSGLWPDGWASREFNLKFCPTRTVKKLHLKAWVPQSLSVPQKVVLRLGGVDYEAIVQPGQVHHFNLAVRLPEKTSVALEISASSDWKPSSDGISSDDRLLAWHLVELVLEH